MMQTVGAWETMTANEKYAAHCALACFQTIAEVSGKCCEDEDEESLFDTLLQDYTELAALKCKQKCRGNLDNIRQNLASSDGTIELCLLTVMTQHLGEEVKEPVHMFCEWFLRKLGTLPPPLSPRRGAMLHEDHLLL